MSGSRPTTPAPAPSSCRAGSPTNPWSWSPIRPIGWGAPKLKRIIMRHTPEAAAQRLALQKGDVDIARDLTADQIKGLAGDKNVVVSQHPSADTWYAAVNLKDDRLKNPKVREALRYLVDYDGMVATFLKGQFIVHQSFWPSGFFASLNDNPYKLDVAKAK